MSESNAAYLPLGLPAPRVDDEGLSAPFWQGLREHRLLMQHCRECEGWQFGPEWICHRCHAFDPAWDEVAPQGRIYSWERVWYAAHPALQGHAPYLVVLVELPQAGGVRLLGNLLGDAMVDPVIGSSVEGIFEPHDESDPPFTLLQWRSIDG